MTPKNLTATEVLERERELFKKPIRNQLMEYLVEREYYKLKGLGMMKQVTQLSMVRDFHKKYGHPISDEPTWKEAYKRGRMVTEEYNEAMDELYSFEEDRPIDKERLTKELADLLYVVYGTAVAFGLPIELVFRRTHLSNMTKSTEKDKNGKTRKGPGYEPPVLRDLFEPRVGE